MAFPLALAGLVALTLPLGWIGPRWRPGLSLLASGWFWLMVLRQPWPGLMVLLGLIPLTQVLARRIAAAPHPRPRLGLAIAIALLLWWSLRPGSAWGTLGLSFALFESLGYLIDQQRRRYPLPSLAEFLSYRSFVPKLLAGPLTPYPTWAIQQPRPLVLDAPRLAEALWLIALGLFRKRVIGDRCGQIATLILSQSEQAGSGDLQLALVCLGLQIYFDFAGYTDLARGGAMLLRIWLPENFRGPYFSTSLSEFWRRWHISLGLWLREYLYLPLGGSRRGLGRTCGNLMLVMLLVGAWHGPSPGFLLWGLLQGLGLVLHRLTRTLCEPQRLLVLLWGSWPGQIIGWGLTQAWVFGSWLVFRLPLEQARSVLFRLWGQPAHPEFTQRLYLEGLGLSATEIRLGLLGIGLFMGLRQLWRQRGSPPPPAWLPTLAVPPLLYASWVLAPVEAPPFIYWGF